MGSLPCPVPVGDFLLTHSQPLLRWPTVTEDHHRGGEIQETEADPALEQGPELELEPDLETAREHRDLAVAASAAVVVVEEEAAPTEATGASQAAVF